MVRCARSERSGVDYTSTTEEAANVHKAFTTRRTEYRLVSHKIQHQPLLLMT